MYKTKEAILKKSKLLENTTFGMHDINHRLDNSNNKGNLGQIIEEGFFGFNVNSRAEADFKEAEIELKVTGYIKNKNLTYSAKERLVLNMIDYMCEDLNVFEQSSFWKKNKQLLIVFYLYENTKHLKDFMIHHVLYWNYNEKDIKIIRQDWLKIVKKIKSGEAHLISEGDTLYLGACRKGNKDSKKVHQPFSHILAEKRAFTLKNGYMTYLLRNHTIENNQTFEEIIKDTDILDEMTFEQYLISKVSAFYGQSIENLRRRFDIESTSKSINQMIISKILNIKHDIEKSEELIKGGYRVKTIRTNQNGKVKESMSFPKFNFVNLSQETWEESYTREMFYGSRFMFIVFKVNEEVETLEKIVFHSLSEDDIDVHIHDVYLKTQQSLLKGEVINSIDERGNFRYSFPKIKDNPVSHIRPHGVNRNDTDELPVRDRYSKLHQIVKMCFWLNASYIENIIKSS
jgi:DNA mismatch repair protein MutH